MTVLFIPKIESLPIQFSEVAWCSRYLMTFTYAIVLMIFTQDEVSTRGFWPMDCEGVFKDNVDSVVDGWNGF